MGGGRTPEQDISGLKCAAGFCLVLGILMLPDLTISVPAIVVGSMILCCAGRDVPSLQKQLGCAKCCAITGIVFSAIGIVTVIVIGALMLSVWVAACELDRGRTDGREGGERRIVDGRRLRLEVPCAVGRAPCL